MIKLDPFKRKYWDFYMATAHLAAAQSICKRHTVGALVVTPNGTLSVGWNGTPPGMPNICEDREGKTYPHTIHAEANAIHKMLRNGISTLGCMIFVTRSPCIKCAALIYGAGITTVVYEEEHDDYSGIEFLKAVGIKVYCNNLETQEEALNG